MHKDMKNEAAGFDSLSNPPARGEAALRNLPISTQIKALKRITNQKKGKK